MPKSDRVLAPRVGPAFTPGELQDARLARDFLSNIDQPVERHDMTSPTTCSCGHKYDHEPTVEEREEHQFGPPST